MSSDTALSPFKFEVTAERANVSDCPKTPAMLEPVTPFLIRASWYAATFCSKLLDETDRLKKNVMVANVTLLFPMFTPKRCVVLADN